MATPRAAINEVAQIGVETTFNTPVAASKLLRAFVWTTGGKPTTKQFRGTGRQYPSSSALLTEMSSGKIAGPGDFAQMIYPFSSLWGAPTFTLHGASTTAYDAVWTPPLTGSYASSAKSYTVQVGDAIDAEQYAGVTFTGYNYSFNRKQEVTFGADFIAPAFTDGITLTATPTAVEEAPMTGAQMDVYLDTTSAGIGATRLTDVLKCENKASGYYDAYWPLNRASNTYGAILDKEKKHDFSLTLQANSTAIAMRSSYLETGSITYVRVMGVGQVIDATHSVNATLTHDMALFCSNMAEFSDEEGVYAVKYDFVIAEDPTWASGTAQKMTLTSLVSAL